MNYVERTVPRNQYHIYARDYAGEDPPIILMHGFPDNLHLYDLLVPYLSQHRLITFDFLGWGASDKPAGYPYTAKNQEGDLDAVIRQQKLGRVVLVAHDASGPPAIDWAIAHRVNAGENDVIIMPATFGAGLDPSTRKRDRNPALFGTGKWNRVLIDATMNLDYDPDPDLDGARFPPTVWPTPEDEAAAKARWDELGLGKKGG